VVAGEIWSDVHEVTTPPTHRAAADHSVLARRRIGSQEMQTLIRKPVAKKASVVESKFEPTKRNYDAAVASEISARVYHSLADLPVQYDALFSAASAQSFFLCRSWFEVLATDGLEEYAALRLYGAERRDGTAVALLVARAPASADGSIFDEATLKRGSLGSAANFHTVYFAPLTRGEPNEIRRALNCIATVIRAERPVWGILDFNSIDRSSPLFAMLVDALNDVGYVVRPYFQYGNWYEPTAGKTFRDYMQARPSVLRNTVKRRGRKLDESGEGRFEVVTGGEALETGIATYEQIHAASWKEPEKFPCLVGGIIRAAASVGALRLGIYYINAEPAAAQLWLVSGGHATIHKLDYDARFQAQSVGTILTSKMMEWVIEKDRVTEIDFGCYDEEYKSNWMSKRREIWAVAAFDTRVGRAYPILVQHVMRDAFRSMIQPAKARIRPLIKRFKRRSSSGSPAVKGPQTADGAN
jgi:hypothetical protein